MKSCLAKLVIVRKGYRAIGSRLQQAVAQIDFFRAVGEAHRYNALD